MNAPQRSPVLSKGRSRNMQQESHSVSDKGHPLDLTDESLRERVIHLGKVCSQVYV